MKKKVSNCVTVLSQVNSSLFGSDATFSHLIKSLSLEAENPAAQTDLAKANPEAAATAEEAFEFDKKFIGLIDQKRREIFKVELKLSNLKYELSKNKKEREQLTAQLKSEREVNEKQKAELKLISTKV